MLLVLVGEREPEEGGGVSTPARRHEPGWLAEEAGRIGAQLNEEVVDCLVEGLAEPEDAHVGDTEGHLVRLIDGLDVEAGYRPLKPLAPILAVFGTAKDGWGLAYWFASANSFLGGKRPQDVLPKSPDRVLAAADDEMAEIAHG